MNRDGRNQVNALIKAKETNADNKRVTGSGFSRRE